MRVRTGLQRLMTHWHRRRLATELGRLDEQERAFLLKLARLWELRRRRWWWVDEFEGVYLIG